MTINGYLKEIISYANMLEFPEHQQFQNIRIFKQQQKKTRMG